MDAGIKEKVSGNDGEKNDVKGDRELVLVRRAQRTRVPVAFLVQGPCEPDDSYVTECFTCNAEATMSTANGMGDRKPGGRAFEPARPGSPLPAPPTPRKIQTILSCLTFIGCCGR